MLDERFVFLGSAIAFIGTISYVVATVRGQVKPNRLSFFIIALAPMVAFAAEIDDGVGLRSLVTFQSGFSPFLIFLASFANRNAYWKLTRFDFACAGLSVPALILWALTGSGDIAITLAIAADLLACLPILRKAWTHPDTESPWLFLAGGTNAGIALLVLDRHTYADFAFPLYLALFCVTMMAFITTRRQRARIGTTQRGE